MKKPFKDYIYYERVMRRWTQKELAKRSGISTATICRLEKGERSNPSLKVMKGLASAFNTTASDIFEVVEFDT